MLLKAVSRFFITIVFSIFFFFYHPKSNPAVKKLEELYQEFGFSHLFVKIRLWDSPIQQLETLIPKKGTIIELGSGEGLCSNYLALTSDQRFVIGIEIDKDRIAQAQRGIKNTKFIYGDITKLTIDPADVLILLHVLHHLNSPDLQVEVLKICYQKLKKNGQFFIVEVKPKFSLKYFNAWFVDHFLVPWLFEKRFYSPIYFRKPEEWVNILRQVGFKTKIIPAEKGTPFSHIIYQCTKA